eukprot:gene12215-biopygen10299
MKISENFPALLTRPSAEAWLPWGILFGDKLDLLELWSAAEKREELRGCIGMMLETVNDIPVESPGDVTDVSCGTTSLRLCFRTDPTDADPIAALAAPSDPGSQKGQGDEQQDSITSGPLSHLATQFDQFSGPQEHSLKVLGKARAQSPSKSSKRTPQVSLKDAIQGVRQGSWRYLLGGDGGLAMVAARDRFARA